MDFRKFFLALFLLGFSGVLLAQEPPKLTLAERTIQRSFPFSERVQSFLFHYRNSGEAPLIISRVAPSCACVVADFSKEPLAPGDSATFTLRYTPLHTGDYNYTITIVSNGQPEILRARIRGTVTEAEEKKSENE